MTAVGDDLRRTCTCATQRWGGERPSIPMRVETYRPVAAGTVPGEIAATSEMIVVTMHYFDGRPCHVVDPDTRAKLPQA